MKAEPQGEFFERVDSLIKAGKPGVARALLLEKLRGSFASGETLPLARALRRVNESRLAIQLLHGQIFDAHGRAIPGDELAEYCTNLARLGASAEVLALLESVPPRKDFLWSRMAARIAQWEPQAALADLDLFHASPNVTDYERLTARVNMANALNMAARWTESLRVVEDLMRELTGRDHALLRANALGLHAQAALEMHEVEIAEQDLHQARSLVEGASATFDNLFLEKISAFTMCVREPAGHAARILEPVRARARAHGPTLRDLDRYLALRTRDVHLAGRVFHGTPFALFRAQFEARCAKEGLAIPPSHCEGTGEAVIDVHSGESGAFRLRCGTLPHLLFQALTRDLYRAPTRVMVHGLVYPHKRFHPIFSPACLDQAFARLRAILSEAGVSASFAASEGTIRWNFDRIAVRYGTSGPDDLSRLAAAVGHGRFSARTCASSMGIPLRTAQRLLKSLCDEGSVEQVARGAGTLYQIAEGVRECAPPG